MEAGEEALGSGGADLGEGHTAWLGLVSGFAEAPRGLRPTPLSGGVRRLHQTVPACDRKTVS